MTYLIIDLHASKASMLQCISVIAPTPVFAALMCTHALEKKLDDRLGIRGVGLIHKNYQPWIDSVENSKGYLEHNLIQRRGAYQFDPVRPKKGEPLSTPLQPNALADYHWSLLLDCEHNISPELLLEIKYTMQTMRFAGGVISKVQVKSTDDWDTALKMSKPGFWIDDVSERLVLQDSPFVSLIDACQTGSWVMPSTLGYACLTMPTERVGARDAKDHAFVEHMLGLVQFSSMGKRMATLTPDQLWRYGWDADQFLVTNRVSAVLSVTPTF